MRKKTLTRRDSLKAASAVPLAGALAPSLQGLAETPAIPAGASGSLAAPPGKVRVVLVRDKDCLDENGRPIAAVVQKMLDDAVCALLDQKDPVAAWRTLVKPELVKLGWQEGVLI